MTKPMILGEAPGVPYVDYDGLQMNRFPFAGRSGRFLLELFDSKLHDELHTTCSSSQWREFYWPLVEKFDLENVIDYYPGPSGDGTAFPMLEARDAIVRREFTDRDRVVIVCGVRVLETMRLADARSERNWKHETRWTSWFTWRSWRCVAIPHPSDLNRLYNDSDMRFRVGVEMANAITVVQRREEGASA